MPTKVRPMTKNLGCYKAENWNAYSGWVASPLYWSGSPTTVYNTVTVGDNIPGWKERIRQRVSATTSLTGERITFVDNPRCVITSLQTAGPYFIYYRQVGSDIPAAPQGNHMSLTSADNDAIQRFVSKALAAQRPFRAAPFLAELTDTIRFIRSPFTSLRSVTSKNLSALERKIDAQWRSARFRAMSPRQKLSRFSDILERNWLTLRFAILPLMSEIDDLAQAASRIAVEPPPTIFVSGRGSAKDFDAGVTIGPTTPPDASGYVKGSYRTETKRSATVRYYGVVKVQPGSVLAPFGLDGAGFIRDFVPAVWEAIPYSFLVDYFTNLGGFLEGLCFCSSSVAWCNRGSKTILDVTTFRTINPGAGISGAGTYDTSYKSEKVTRSAYSGSFIPSLQFKLPGSSVKWMNIGALASQFARVSLKLRP